MATTASTVYAHITKDPDVCGGNACIDRTRVRVMDIVALEREGYTPEKIRAIDVFPGGTSDSELFRYAAEQERIFVTNDNRIAAIGEQWLANGDAFTGLIVCELAHHRRFSEGWFHSKFADLAEEDDPFFYPVRHFIPD